MQFRVPVALLVVATLTLVGCGSDPGIETGGSTAAQPAPGGVDLSLAEFVDLSTESAPEVDAIDNVFKPKYVTVKAGATITFRNDGRNSHNVLPVEEDEFIAVPTEAFEPGAEAPITFAEAGDYPYYCSLHGTTTRGMVGAVRVVE